MLLITTVKGYSKILPLFLEKIEFIICSFDCHVIDYRSLSSYLSISSREVGRKVWQEESSPGQLWSTWWETSAMEEESPTNKTWLPSGHSSPNTATPTSTQNTTR